MVDRELGKGTPKMGGLPAPSSPSKSRAREAKQVWPPEPANATHPVTRILIRSWLA